MGLVILGSIPKGRIGYVIRNLTNLFHIGYYREYYAAKLPEPKARILDIGCGEGSFIKYLVSQDRQYRVFGVDYSRDMIELSGGQNKKAVRNGMVTIVHAGAEHLPFSDNSLDFITANETVQLWSDNIKSFSEVHRVLRKGGKFHIINMYPAEGTKWWKIAKLKNKEDYQMALESAGFNITSLDTKTKPNWIMVEATKG